MKSKISLFLTGVSYIAGSFANVSTTSSYTHKPLPSDSASLSKDWANVGNSTVSYTHLPSCTSKL